jgi:hypothetical protein
MTVNKTPRTFVALGIPQSVPPLLAAGRHVVGEMSNNPLFPSPQPTLATVSKALDDLEAAQSVAMTRAHGATAARDEKRAVVVTQLGQLKAYVQTVIDAHPPEQGASIAASAGMAVRKARTRKQRVFAAKPGAVSGAVDLVAPQAARRASYEWEYSVDGGKTWLMAPPSLKARTTVFGLQPGASVTFRWRAVLKTGAGDWSDTVTIIVR